MAHMAPVFDDWLLINPGSTSCDSHPSMDTSIKSQQPNSNNPTLLWFIYGLSIWLVVDLPL